MLVVMEDEKVLGIITERDYARKIILLGRSSKETPVREIVTSQVICARSDQTNEECMGLMTDRRVRHLSVVDRGRLTGLVSIGDLVKDIISEQKQTTGALRHGGARLRSPQEDFRSRGDDMIFVTQLQARSRTLSSRSLGRCAWNRERWRSPRFT